MTYVEKRRNEAAIRAAIYVRISRDKEGAGLGVERQEADARALAERLGWPVVGTFTDNDISAYSGKHRPGYSALLRAIRSGEVNAVLAWHTDRLHRRAAELEEFVSLVDSHHVQVETVTAGTLDLSTPTGRLVARLLGATAQHEVDHMRERLKRAKDQMAAQGRNRGTPRPYGYDRIEGDTRLRINKREAEVIRWAAKQALDGRTLAGITRDLNKQGHKTSKGRPWTYGTLRSTLVRPRNAGLIGHGRSDRPGFDPTDLIEATEWEPIITPDEWRAVYNLLMDPSRQKQNGNDVRWLGSGLYRCGVCDLGTDDIPSGTLSTLRPAPYGGTHKRKGPRQHLYRCQTRAHLTIHADRTDEFVLATVAELISDPRIAGRLTPAKSADAAIETDRRERDRLVLRLRNFEDDYAQGLISGRVLADSTKRVTAQIDQIEAKLAAAQEGSATAPVLTASEPGKKFLAAPLDVQRAVLAAVVRVTILPVPYRGAAWTSDRIRFDLAV